MSCHDTISFPGNRKAIDDDDKVAWRRRQAISSWCKAVVSRGLPRTAGIFTPRFSEKSYFYYEQEIPRNLSFRHIYLSEFV